MRVFDKWRSEVEEIVRRREEGDGEIEEINGGAPNFEGELNGRLERIEKEQERVEGRVTAVTDA